MGLSSLDSNVESKISENSTINNSVDNDGIKKQYKREIIWVNVIALAIIHLAALYAIPKVIFLTKWKSIIFVIFYASLTSNGVTSGAHRLWTHRSYKAKLPLRIFLMILQTTQMQTPIIDWVRDHRVHHKFTETDADPHNSKRGFFFSHVGWLMLKKHEDVKTKGKTVDLSDVLADPVVRFQKKYYFILIPIISIAIPFAIPVYFFGEDPWASFHLMVSLRYALTLNFTWLVNSAAHIYGTRPYDKNIGPTQNFWVSMLTSGEGWHNYHHVYPWDYKTDELGAYASNTSTMFIDAFAKIGWAYDLKTVSPEIIQKRILRTGDGSKTVSKKYDDLSNDIDNHHKKVVWGWGDVDMPEEDINDIKMYNSLKDN